MLKWTSGGSLNVVETGLKFEATKAKQAKKGALKTSERPSRSDMVQDTAVLRPVQKRKDFHERKKVGETCDESGNRNGTEEEQSQLRDISVSSYPQEWEINDRQNVNIRKDSIFKKFKTIFKRSSSRGSVIKSAPSSPTVHNSSQDMVMNDMMPNSIITKDIDGRKPTFTSKDRKSRLERLIDAQRVNRREREQNSKSQTRQQAFSLDINGDNRQERGRISRSQTRLRAFSVNVNDDNRRERLHTSKAQTRQQLFPFDTTDDGNCKKCSEAGQRRLLFWNNDSSTADISFNFCGKDKKMKQVLGKNKVLTPPVTSHLKNWPLNNEQGAIDTKMRQSCKNYRSETQSDTCVLSRKSDLKGMGSFLYTPRTSRQTGKSKTYHGDHNGNPIAEDRKQCSISFKDGDTAVWRRILNLSPQKDGDYLQQWIGKMRAIDSHSLHKAKRSLRKVRPDLDEETTQTELNEAPLKRDTSGLFSWSRSQEGGMLVSPKTRLKHAYLLSSPNSLKSHEIPLSRSDWPMMRNNNNGHKNMASQKYMDDLEKEDSLSRSVTQRKDDNFLLNKNETLPITSCSTFRRPGYYSLDSENQSRVKRIVHTLEEKMLTMPAVKSSPLMINISPLSEDITPICQSPQMQIGNQLETTVKDYRASNPGTPKTFQNIPSSKDDSLSHPNTICTLQDSLAPCLGSDQIHVPSDSKECVQAVSTIGNSLTISPEPQSAHYSSHEDVNREQIGNAIFDDGELAVPCNDDKSMPRKSDPVFSDSCAPDVSGDICKSTLVLPQNNQIESLSGNFSPHFELIRNDSLLTQSDNDFSDSCAPDGNVSDGAFQSSQNIAQSDQMESPSGDPPFEQIRKESMPTKPDTVFSDSGAPDVNVSASAFQSNLKRVMVEDDEIESPPFELITNENEPQVDGLVIDKGNLCESKTPKAQIQEVHGKNDVTCVSDAIAQNHIGLLAKDFTGPLKTQQDLKDEAAEKEDIIKQSDEIVNMSLSSGPSAVEKEERVRSSEISKEQEGNFPDLYVCTTNQERSTPCFLGKAVLKTAEDDSEGAKEHGPIVNCPSSTEMFYEVKGSGMESISSPKSLSPPTGHFIFMYSGHSGVPMENGSKDQDRKMCNLEEHALPKCNNEFPENLFERRDKGRVHDKGIAIGQNSDENLRNFLEKAAESGGITQIQRKNSEHAYSNCTTQISSASADKALRELSFSSSDISSLKDSHSIGESAKLITKSNSLFNMTFVYNEQEIESHSPDTPPASPASIDATKENLIYRGDSQQELRHLPFSSSFDVQQDSIKETDVLTLDKNEMIVSGTGESRKDKGKSKGEKCIQVDFKDTIVYAVRNELSDKSDVESDEYAIRYQSKLRSTEEGKVQNGNPCFQCLNHRLSKTTIYRNQEILVNGSESRDRNKNDETYDISPWTESSPRNEGSLRMIQGGKMPFHEIISKDDAGLTLAARNQSADLVASRIIDYYNFVHSQQLASDGDINEKVTLSSAGVSESQSGLSCGISGDGCGDRSESSRSKEVNSSDNLHHHFHMNGRSKSAFTDSRHVSFTAGKKELLSFKNHRQRHSGIRKKAHLKKKMKITAVNPTSTEKPNSEELSTRRSISNHSQCRLSNHSQSTLQTGTGNQKEHSLFPASPLRDDDTAGRQMNEVNQSSENECHQGKVAVTKGSKHDKPGQWIFLGIMLFFQFLIHWLYAH